MAGGGELGDSWRRWIMAGGALAVVVTVGVAVMILWVADDGRTDPPPPARPTALPPDVVAQQFFTAFSSGDLAKAASLTDHDSALGLLGRSRNGMRESTFSARIDPPAAVPRDATTATITAEVTWTLPGPTPWTYPTSLELRRGPDSWKVHWAPAVLHPQLTDGQTLSYQVIPGAGTLVDRDGAPRRRPSTGSPCPRCWSPSNRQRVNFSPWSRTRRCATPTR